MLLKVGVSGFFVSDGGCRAMAGIYDGIVGKGHQAGLDSGDEFVVAAAKKVGTPDAAGEKGVAG